MCFHIHPEYSEPRTAHKDIIVYKTGRGKGEFTSVHMHHLYKKRVTQPLLKLDIITDEYSSSYVDQGYHSFTTLRHAMDKSNWHMTVRKMIIPKGTLYYINPDYNEIVSETIIYVSNTNIFVNWLKRILL